MLPFLLQSTWQNNIKWNPPFWNYKVNGWLPFSLDWDDSIPLEKFFCCCLCCLTYWDYRGKVQVTWNLEKKSKSGSFLHNFSSYKIQNGYLYLSGAGRVSRPHSNALRIYSWLCDQGPIQDWTMYKASTFAPTPVLSLCSNPSTFNGEKNGH